jgi:molecular chaperone GrpE
MCKTENNSNDIEIKVLNEDEIENNQENDSINNKAIQNELSEESTRLKTENNYLEKLQRLQAEFVNYKKRIERERLDLSDYLKSELVSTLLPILDDLERLLYHSNSDQIISEPNEALLGIQLIYQNLLEILKKEGLKPIKSVGQKFDPNVHEALLIDPSSNGEYEIVAEEWRKGYFFKERLLRPAQVKVAKIENAVEN